MNVHDNKRVIGSHFTGFIYTVLRWHISDRINHRSFYQIPRHSTKTGKFRGNE